MMKSTRSALLVATCGLALLASPAAAQGLRVEAAHSWDSNVNRAYDSRYRLSDRSYSASVAAGGAWPFRETVRFVGTGFVSGDRFVRYSGLSRISVGGQGELQYRASGEFGAPTLGLLARLVREEYEGRLRSGDRLTLGLTYRQSLTDRIDAFASLSAQRRRADHDAFAARDWTARAILDYALGPGGTVYLGGEHRRGDVVSTLPPSPAYGFAKASVPDDVYGPDPRVSYRYEARTVIWTLGWNLPLGTSGALELTLRHARSKPTATPNPVYGISARYTASQASLAYLMRF